MKKKTRKKVIRRKRRSMREKRVMQIKRGLMKRAKKLRLGAKRTGAYVYGTLRRIVGNRSLRRNEGLGYTPYIPESGFLVAKTTGYHDTPSGKFQLLKKGQVLRILFTTKERRGGGTTGKEYFVAETTDHPYEGMKVLVEKGYAGKIYNSDPRKSSSRYGNRLMANPGVKQGYALIRGGGPSGMKMVVVSTHKTREGAENAMIKKGGTPESLFTKGYSIFAFGPGTRYEYLDSEFTGKFLRPIVGNPGHSHRERIAIDTVKNPMKGYFLGGPDLAESVRYLRSLGYSMAQLKKINPDVEDQLSGKKSILPNRHRGLRGNPMRSSFDKPTFGPMNTETRRVDTTTMAGMKEAERLQRAGWYQGPVTLFSTTYYRKRALPKSSIARQIRGNPPMYAHRMMSHRTHGLSLKQMMKLYRLVSSGNPKAVMFARRTLGIPMSESLSQVKAVVYHHVLDLKGKI